jgi:hypothetical protein
LGLYEPLRLQLGELSARRKTKIGIANRPNARNSKEKYSGKTAAKWSANMETRAIIFKVNALISPHPIF